MDNKADLTTGSILKKLVFVSLPIMATQMMSLLYNLTNMFWLGRLSSDDVAASGASGMYLMLSIALLALGRTGAEVGVSQNKGRNDLKTAASFVQNSLLLAVVVGVIYGLFCVVFCRPLIAFFNIREVNVNQAAISYLRIIGIGLPFTFITAALTGAFNGAGNSKTPFLINALGVIINVILDPLLIFQLELGIEGAAFASVIGQLTVCLLIIIAMKKHKDRPLKSVKLISRPEVEKMKLISKWGTPVVLEFTVFTLLSMMVSRIISDFGADAIAVQRVATQIESLSWLIGGGFGTAVTAFMGQNFGANKTERIQQGFKLSSWVMFSWGCAITLVLYCGGYYLIGLFLPAEHLKIMGAYYLKVLAIGQIVSSIEGIGSGYFRGKGRTVAPSISSIIANIIRVPLCWLLSQTVIGVNGIWWGVSLTAIMRGGSVYGLALWDLTKSRKQVKS